MPALAEAFVRVRPNTSGFRRETERDIDRQGMGKVGEKAGKQFGDGFSRGAKGFDRDGSTIGRVAAVTAARITVMGAAAAAAAPAVLHLAAALAPAAGAAVALPTVLLGAAAAMGTLKLATSGVGEAIGTGLSGDAEKAAEAMGKLPPAAQRFARSIIALKPQLDRLRAAVASRFFRPFADDMRGLTATYLPLMQRQLPAIAGSLGRFTEQLVKAARQGPLVRGLNATLGGTAAGIDKARAAVKPLADALGNLLITASPLLKQMGVRFAEVATAASNAISRAAASGSLVQILRDGVTTLQTLGGIVSNVFSIIRSVMAAASAGGATLLDTVLGLTGQFAAFLQTAEGMQGLQAVFSTLGAIGAAFRTALAAVLPAIAQSLVIIGPQLAALAPIAAQLVVALAPLLPYLVQLVATVAGALTPAIAATVGWLIKHENATKALAVTIGALLAVTKLHATFLAVQAAGSLAKYLTQINIVSAATKAWAAVQWVLDAAMAANPIGLVVVGIAALVAAVILAYQHSDRFRAIVQGAWQGIQAAVSYAWNNVLKPTFTAIGHFFRDVIAPAALWLWHNVLEPAWKGISAAVSFAWNIIQVDLNALRSFFLSVIAPAVAYMYNNVFKPAFAAISAVVQVAWTVIKIILDGLRSFFVNVIGPTVMWLWNNVFKPAWAGIQAAISVAWTVIKVILGALVGFFNGVIMPAVNAIWNVFKIAWAGISFAIHGAWVVIQIILAAIKLYLTDVLAPAMLWLYNNVVKPAWSGISAVVSLATNTVKGTLEGMRAFLTGVIAPAINWLYNNVIKPVFGLAGGFIAWVWTSIIRPAFDGIKTAFNAVGTAIGWVWNTLIKPIFTALGSFISGSVAPAFAKGVDAIKTAWEKIRETAAAPVRFIVNTVINKGIVGGLNWIAEKVGVKDRIPLLNVGFAAGGYTGRLPGAPSAVDNLVGMTPSGPIGLAGGEYVVNAAQTRKNLPLLDAINRGVPGYADGGLVGLLTSPAKWLSDRIALSEIKARFGANSLTDSVLGAGNRLKDLAITKIKSMISGLLGGGGGGAGPGFPPWPSSPGAARGDSGVWRSISNLIRSSGIGQGSFGNGYRAGDPLWHGSGRAVDWMGYNMDALASYFMAMRPRVLELIHRTNRRDYAITRGRDMGSFDESLMNAHRNHLHIAMAKGGVVPARSYDSGGAWPSGTVGINTSGRTEHVATGATMDALVDLLGELIDAVRAVAPGVGRELSGGMGSARQLARAR